MIEYIIRGKCKSYDEVPDGATIETVNGRYVFAFCEGCGKPLFCDMDMVGDGEGVYLHRKCAKGISGS